MERIATFLATYHSLRSKRKAAKRLARMRQERKTRRRWFRKKQAIERFFFVVLLSATCENCLTERTVWIKERSNHWWDHILMSTFNSHDWLENFRMSQSTFLYLCNELQTSIQKKDTLMRKAISPNWRLAIALWFLAPGGDYRTIGHLFGVAKSTVCLVLKDVCTSIVKILLPRYVTFPKGEVLREVVDGFKSDLRFPQCGGAVDGSHIPIVSPQECPADYYNRKGWHSVILQGTVDHRGRFTDIYIGWPGRVHDARVFANSSLYQRGQSGNLLSDWKERINGTEVPLVLLGDPAYPLLTWLMKAYPNNGHLTREQKRFNYRLSKARVVVEHCYGRLKGRWRCLLKLLDVDISNVPEVVAACCVLHNVCEVHGEEFCEEWLQETENARSESASATIANAQSYSSAVSIRNALMSYFTD